MQRVLEEIRICAPNPGSCEGQIEAALVGIHEYDYISNGEVNAMRDDIKAVRVYQEGEGAFAWAVKQGIMIIEPGDVAVVMEFNHGTFNVSLFSEGKLVGALTHVAPRGGLSALASFIKQDELFPQSVRTVDEDLIINAIAHRNPNLPLTYRGLNFQAAFERNVVRWIRSNYNEAKTYWRKAKGKDWVSAINKILCSGGAAPLSSYWKDWILQSAAELKNSGDAESVENAMLMEHMANHLYVCPHSRNSNALGMLELSPPATGLVASIDLGYSALKFATNTGAMGMMQSSYAVPYSKVNPREIGENSAYIRLKSGPLCDKLKKAGHPTSFILGADANSIIDAEKVLHNAKEQLIPQAVLAALNPTITSATESKKNARVVTAQ